MDKDLLTLLTSDATQQRHCDAFRKTALRTVSDSGIIVSPSAQLHEESISKATAAISVQVRSKVCFHKAFRVIDFPQMALCSFLILQNYREK
jgi:hypothetical protein